MKDGRCDVLVIGDGVVGLAIAFEAVRRGLRTALVGKDVRGSATPAAGGMVTLSSEADTSHPALMALLAESVALYPGFARAAEQSAGLAAGEAGFCSRGTLHVALHRDHVAQLERLAEFQRQANLTGEWLDVRAVRQREPGVAARQQGGLWVAAEGHLQPLAFASVLRRALAGAGATLARCDGVSELIRQSGRVDGASFFRSAQQWELHAEATVIAAGLWSNEASAGQVQLPLRAVRGQSIRLRGESLPRCVLRTPEVYLVPHPPHELVIGGTSEESDDVEPHAGDVLTLLRDAWALYPGVDEMVWLESRCGLRPTLPDHRPALGPTSVPGLYVAAGHYRSGVGLAPVSAKWVVDAIEGHALPEDHQAFSALRFGTRPGAAA